MTTTTAVMPIKAETTTTKAETTTKRTTPTPTSSVQPTSSEPLASSSSTAFEMETAISVTPGDTLSNTTAKTEEDDFYPRIPIDGVEDNSLESGNDSVQEKIN